MEERRKGNAKHVKKTIKGLQKRERKGRKKWKRREWRERMQGSGKLSKEMWKTMKKKETMGRRRRERKKKPTRENR